LAESWDNVGLQLGDSAMEVRRLLVALDPEDCVIEEAIAREATLIVSHHPLILRPLQGVVASEGTGRRLLRAAQAGTAIFCAHTNLDRARGGLNDWLAQALDLQDVAVLQQGGDDELFKLVVFVPSGHEEQVSDAIFQAGAGHIGEYDQCSFRTEGTGAAANPFIGEIGRREAVSELRLETVVPREYLTRVLQKMIKAHPYEEPAYDLIPLQNSRSDVGLGRIGRLSEELPLDTFARQVAQGLQTEKVRVVGSADRPVSRVAVCGGSGASLIGEAARQGADVLVTGDIKYHEARQAQEKNLCLVDAGHFASERVMVAHLAQVLRDEADKQGWNIEILEAQGESEPFRFV
jgi:dinuclear metal center YbgI/SA1388 family protein